MDTLSYRTQSAKKETVERNWWIVDAEGKTLGRLASEIAKVLRGKHKACFTPHVDTGDYVIIINAEKINLTGRKLQKKVYLTYSGYPGGQKSATAAELLAKRPRRVLENAIKGMLPKNKLGRATFKKLFVYEGSEHPHQAQKPQTFDPTNK
ncbi:ribosomal protein L13, bacterial type [Saprospira grandis DSM 2844]|uniref:Large ribosomal subunit protein uL13 n=1 Tax=Saprospira grandis DSM 2844 TaxID=694433 RepID=J0XX29_9BACT|nr:50S ribosomal protein L13 [Saprospira grandis]EJF53606.1 ribosomal protein L13, bacterial type [Saprospira grandis DSM 2844]